MNKCEPQNHFTILSTQQGDGMIINKANNYKHPGQIKLLWKCLKQYGGIWKRPYTENEVIKWSVKIILESIIKTMLQDTVADIVKINYPLSLLKMKFCNTKQLRSNICVECYWDCMMFNFSWIGIITKGSTKNTKQNVKNKK